MKYSDYDPLVIYSVYVSDGPDVSARAAVSCVLAVVRALVGFAGWYEETMPLEVALGAEKMEEAKQKHSPL